MTAHRDDAGTQMADGCAAFEALLPDYLEGTLAGAADASAAAAARAHIVACDACRTLVRDLERIRSQAAALPIQRPSSDLWAGIEARIQAPVRLAEHEQGGRAPAARGFALGWATQPWARAAVLVVATAGVTLVATRHWSATPAPTAATQPLAPSTTRSPVASAAHSASPRTPPVVGQPGTTVATVATVKNDGHAPRSAAPTSEFIYDQQIAALHRIVDARHGQLNPKTRAVIEKNLRLIDAAIAESKAALAKDPANGFLAQQLDATLSTKLDLLRTVAMLPSRT
jgi:hypothetical protein